jgi:hypothetical protein
MVVVVRLRLRGAGFELFPERRKACKITANSAECGYQAVKMPSIADCRHPPAQLAAHGFGKMLLLPKFSHASAFGKRYPPQ